MAAPAPSWNTCRVYGTWHKLDGSRRTGTYKVTVPVRVTNATDDVIVPAGVAMTGTLEVDSGSPSLDILVPASDDPDNSPHGWQPVIEVTFPDAAGERYVIDTPVDGEVNLRTVVLAESIPVPKDVLIRGVPGGLAELDAEGLLVREQIPEDIGGGLDEAALEGYLETNVLPTVVPTTRTVAGKPLSGDVSLAASDVGAVPTTRTVAGKALSSNVTLDPSDITGLTAELAAKADASSLSGYVPTTRTIAGKALSANVTLTASDVSAVPTTRTVAGKALSGDVTLAASDVGAVPTSRTVNGKSLSSNVSLTASDVGAAPGGIVQGVLPTIFALDEESWPAKTATLTAYGIPTYDGPVVWDGALYMTTATWVEPADLRDGDRRRVRGA